MTTKKNLKILNVKNKSNIKKVILLNKPHKKKDKKFKDKSEFLIQFSKVHKLFTNGFVVKKALIDVNLNIKKGEFVVIEGKSGSGKTTLMNIMSGLNRASSGTTRVMDNNLIAFKDGDLRKFRKENTSFVFQQYGLVQTLTVYENVKSGSNLASKRAKKSEIMDMLDLVGIKRQWKSFPRQLSGGQQQRVSIARALMKKPILLFCDEPTGSLDSQSAYNVLKLFKQVNFQNKTTIIIITHDERIGKIADHLIKVEDGRIIFDKYQKPLEEFKDLFI